MNIISKIESTVAEDIAVKSQITNHKSQITNHKSQNGTEKKTLYFKELVGFRIYLALWVALGHGIQTSGILESRNLFIKFLLRGDSAVQIFIIISGFVITSLIIQKREPYFPYITRRFFRLYPAYLLACIIGYLIAEQWVELATSAPWQDSNGWAAYVDTVQGLVRQLRDAFIPHFLLHAVMLHGAVPNEILDHSAMTFLPAAWSISLEWQFYLVAPLVIASLKSARAATIIGIMVGGTYLLYALHHLGTYSIPSSLIINSGLFGIGIASRISYDTLSRYRMNPMPTALILAVMCLILLRDPLAIAIWSIFFSYLAWGGHSRSLDTMAFRRLFLNRFAYRFGEASYSVYLIHRPIQVLIGWCLLKLLVPTSSNMIFAMIFAIVLACAASLLMFRYVEKPGEALGRKLAASVGKTLPARNDT